tara:strand:- start:209 stop:871 length:663 start_codon:yes stop_codon:yes gene_type:complete
MRRMTIGNAEKISKFTYRATNNGDDEVGGIIDFTTFTNLEELLIKNAKFDSVDFINTLSSTVDFINLEQNDFFGLELPATFNANSNLTILKLNNCGLKGTIPSLAPFSNLERFQIGAQRYSTWTNSGFLKVLKDRHGMPYPHTSFSGVAEGFAVPSTLAYSSYRYNEMDADTINTILIAYDTAGGTNGTLDIRGNFMATPTGDGLTAQANLLTKGWTILS